jgi:hypothetical protein
MEFQSKAILFEVKSVPALKSHKSENTDDFFYSIELLSSGLSQTRTNGFKSNNFFDLLFIAIIQNYYIWLIIALSFPNDQKRKKYAGITKDRECQCI